MGVTARRHDPALLAGAIGAAIAGIELLSWSVVAAGGAVAALVVGSRLLARLSRPQRTLLGVALLAVGAVALAAVAVLREGGATEIAARAVGAACFAYAARQLWRRA